MINAKDLSLYDSHLRQLLYNRAACTDVGSAISGTMTLLNVSMFFFLTDAASDLQVSNSRLQELETVYATQKSEVINSAQKFLVLLIFLNSVMRPNVLCA